MANNRLYLTDGNGDSLMVAKSFGDGWRWTKTEHELTEWLAGRDAHASIGGPQPITGTELRLKTENDIT